MTTFSQHKGDDVMRNRWWVGPSLAAAAVLLAACGSTGSPTNAVSANVGSGSDAIKTMTTSKGTVLVNAAGFTLYWFAIDTATQSNCSGSCTAQWPPLLGTAVAAKGTSLPHSFGTIKRANGQTQVTYDGHPLYTFKGDRAAGQVVGNGINLSGGLWWAVTPSGAMIPASLPPPSGG
jgi:predicted lipoprotein with Yx(FWY)xxD motif